MLAAGLALVSSAVLSLVEPADHGGEGDQAPAAPRGHHPPAGAPTRSVDPALIAAVIYTESRFRDQTSHVGAKGLMQIMPETADYIARKSGGTQFERADLATPQINIAYGTWYLRYLLDKYDGNTILTLAAYNAGEGKVDEWRRRPRAAARSSASPTTSRSRRRATTCGRVLSARADYRRTYARELGCNVAGITAARRPRHCWCRRRRPHIHPRSDLRRLPHRDRRRPRRHGHRVPRDAARARAGPSR